MNGDKDLEQRIATLEQVVAAQAEQIEQMREAARSPGAVPVDAVIDRRSLLRSAGMGAVGVALGGAAAVGAASPAAAATGDAIRMGQTTTGAAPTVAVSGTVTTTGFAFTDDATYAPSLPALGSPAALVTIAGAGSGNGMSGLAASGSGHGVGVSANGGDYGLVATGALAPIRLDGGSALSPHLDTRVHLPGELALQLTGSGPILWFCVKPGAPGEWRKVAAPETAATFTPTSPQRLYDSRTTDGPLASGQTRVVNLGTPSDPGKNVSLVNLTVTATVGGGWLQLCSNALAVQPLASAINWFASSQTFANTTVVEVDADGRIKVTAGGDGSTQFIIDSLGWFS